MADQHTADLLEPEQVEDTQPQAEECDESSPSVESLQNEIDMLRKHDEAAREIGEEIARLKSKYENAKSISSDYKKQLEAAYERLAEHSRQRPTYGPLFDKPDDEAVEDKEGRDPTDWRGVPLCDLGIADTVLEKLAEYDPPLTTIGELSDFTAGDGRLTDIPGVGDAKAEVIEQALEKFLAEQNQPVDSSEPEEIEEEYEHEDFVDEVEQTT